MSPKNTEHTTHHAQMNRLKRIEGQVRGLQKMINSEKYCINILQQFKSVHAALGTVENEIMKRHVEKCVVSAAQRGSKKEIDKKLDEIMNVVKSIRKS